MKKRREREITMKSSNRKNIIIGIAIIMILTIGTVMAFFTDTDTVSNSFTVGNISIALEEPNWDPDEGKDITPNKTVKKDPQITNDGANDAFVFMQVKVPLAEIKTANDNGSLNPSAKKELFSYSVDNSWKMVKKSAEESFVTYVYAYVGTDGNMKKLAPGQTTKAVFDSVTFVNAVEGQLESRTLNIDVDAMGVQTGDLKTTSPEGVYAVLINQAK